MDKKTYEVIDEDLPSESIINRRDDLYDGICNILKGLPINVSIGSCEIDVNFEEKTLCRVVVERDGYGLFFLSSDVARGSNYTWELITSASPVYPCEIIKDETWYTHIETIDECVGEARRLVLLAGKRKSVVDEDISFEKLVSKYGLDIPENYVNATELRKRLSDLLNHLVAGTNFWLENNVKDGNKHLNVMESGNEGRQIYMHSLSNMSFWVAFKKEKYDALKSKADLPANMKADKYPNLPHINVSLQKVWNTMCVLTEKERYMVAEPVASFETLFAKPEDVPTGKKYDIYIEGAKKIWNLYSNKYDLVPRSKVNVLKGKNSSIFFYRNGKRLIQISIGLTTTIYVYDKELLKKIDLDYEIDPSGDHRCTMKSVDDVLKALEGIL